MSAPHAESMIQGYLARLLAAAADLPAAARDELVDDVRSHITEARAREAEETDSSILNILDRLGEPNAVIAEARERLGVKPSRLYQPGLLEIAAIILLILAWPVGVVLLWISPAWKLVDKLIGTLLPPGGYPFILFLGLASARATVSSSSCPFDTSGTEMEFSCATPGPPWWWQAILVLMTILLFVLPLITAGYLAVRLRWGRQPQAAVI
jgi:HAAS domain-containing protein